MIILGLASLWALYHSIKNKNLITAIITLGLIAGIVLVFINFNNSINTGVIVFLIFATIALLYSFLYFKFPFDKRLILAFIILPIIFYWIFHLRQLPGANFVWMGLFVPFFALLYLITKPVNLKNEWGFIIILLAEAFTHIYPIIIQIKIF